MGECFPCQEITAVSVLQLESLYIFVSMYVCKRNESPQLSTVAASLSMATRKTL